VQERPVIVSRALWCLEPLSDDARPNTMRKFLPLPQALSLVAALTLALTSCAAPISTAETPATNSGDTAEEPAPSRSTQPADSPSEDESNDSDFDRPPRVTVRSPGGSIDLASFSFCYGNVCADGFPPANPPRVGDPDHVLIDFPLDGWSFEATFRPAGEACGRMQTVPLEKMANGSFLLQPAGHADTYDVTLFGRGDGDLATAFRWDTPSDGPLPEPEARLALLAGHDGELDSYGVELAIENLAATPEEATAKITTTAANGQSTTFTATMSRQRCQPVGSLYWDGPDDQGALAADLGPPPFTYQVVMVLDGERHEASADWPTDVIRGNEPSVALSFTPPLPALQ